jgi:hypothetical protein
MRGYIVKAIALLMNDTDLRQKLAGLAGRRILQKWFPGCVIGVVWKNGERLMVPAGNFTYASDSQPVSENSIYDVASVTKAIPTACLLLQLIDAGKLSLSEPVATYIPELKIKDRNNVLIHHLLEFTLNYDNPKYAALDIKHKPGDDIVKFLFTSELATPPGTVYFYSNATAILTGLVVERIFRKPLDVLADEIFFRPLGMTDTSFRPEKLGTDGIVPTEIDPWRGGEVRAEVHDESAWTLRKEMNRCVGSAGLFSSAPGPFDVSRDVASRRRLERKALFFGGHGGADAHQPACVHRGASGLGMEDGSALDGDASRRECIRHVRVHRNQRACRPGAWHRHRHPLERHLSHPRAGGQGKLSRQVPRRDFRHHSLKQKRRR